MPFLDEKYPEAALVSEWGDPKEALEAGFHMDFLLHNGPTHYMDLFRETPYFSKKGDGDISESSRLSGALQPAQTAKAFAASRQATTT